MFKKLSEFILFGSIFIAFCAVGMCVETNLLLHIPLNNPGFYLFVFAATLVQYNLHYLMKKSAVTDSERLVWSLKNKTTHKIIIIAGIALMLVSLFSFQLYHFIILFILGLITLLYSAPLLPFKNKRRIKDFGLLKISTLVLMWTIVTVWFPAQQIALTSPIFLLIFIRRFIFIFILCLMFDIRDIEIDRKENIGTLPVLTGIKTAYIISYVLLFIFIVLSVMGYSINRDFPQLNAMVLSAFATFIVIEFSKKNTSDFVYLACIDGMMLLQALLVIISFF